jgi:predicted component of viral defense system (DUF524 family)
MTVDLKKISEIYEYWVFYKIAVAFLGRDIIVEQQNTVLKNGKIYYGLCFRNENIAVYYNHTESRSRKSSYSIGLRPDTTVVIKKEEQTIKLVFDAKYKVRKYEEEEGMARHVKSEDIFKMHTYVDAIDNCKFSVVVYPGTEFYFYGRNLESDICRDVEEMSTFEGVGALPLVPKNTDLNEEFLRFIARAKEEFS